MSPAVVTGIALGALWLGTAVGFTIGALISAGRLFEAAEYEEEPDGVR